MEWEEIDKKAQRALLQLMKEITEDEDKPKKQLATTVARDILTGNHLENECKRREKYDYRKAFDRIRMAKYRRIGWRLSAVACLLCVILGSFWLLTGPGKITEQHLAKGTLENSHQVVLKMSNGKQIVLNQPEPLNLQEGQRKIQANKKIVDYFHGQMTTTEEEMKYNILSVPNGGEYQVILADGTHVHLNAASELKYPVFFSGDKREVFLKGEAFFDVAKDSEHPFIVKVGPMHVKVLGTRFNINAYRTDGIYETTLTEGKVEVSNQMTTKRVVLSPNQQAQLKDGQLSVREVDASLYTSWINGKFYFEKEFLSEITAQLERWYDIHFFFTREALKQEKFTGVILKDYTIEQILTIIEKTTNVKFSVNGKTVVVR